MNKWLLCGGSLNGSWPLTLLLEAAPHAVELDLSYHSIRGMFLSILHDQGGGNSLVPVLKVLIVQLPVQYSELEAKKVADMIKSRMLMKSSRKKGNGLEKLVAFLDPALTEWHEGMMGIPRNVYWRPHAVDPYRQKVGYLTWWDLLSCNLDSQNRSYHIPTLWWPLSMR